MDPRGTGEIADAAGAVAALAHAGERCAALLAARERTTSELARLRGEIDPSRLPQRSSVVLFGSWGRYELTPTSDIDWALVVDAPAVDPADPALDRALTHLRDVFDERDGPGEQGYFGCAFAAEPLHTRIGLDADDVRNLTRRMLLLLESVAVTGDEVHRDVQDRVLSRYLGYHHRSFRPPRFLLNDVIRYWRTICVDFEGKAAEDRSRGARADKFVMRTAKLRTSRKMLYASGLLPALLCRFVAAADIQPFLRGQLDAPATDRVARAFLHLGHADAAARTMSAYSDWLALLQDRERRATLETMQRGDRKRSPVFRQVRRIGDTLDNSLASLLFESSIAEVARVYAVL